MTTNDFSLDQFTDEDDRRSDAARIMGRAGLALLHLVKVTFVLYSGAHAINVSMAYAGDGALTTAAQVVGIVATELVLAGLYLAWINGRITGAAQTITAGAVYLIGFVMASAAIVGDSQLNGGMALTPWLAFYLRWLLPAAPAIMGLGALLVHSLAPDHIQQRERAEREREIEAVRHAAAMALERAKVEEMRTLHAMRLQSRAAVVQSLGDLWRTDEAQAAIRRTAMANLPQLLRAAGVELDHPTPPATTAPQPVPVADQDKKPHFINGHRA